MGIETDWKALLENAKNTLKGDREAGRAPNRGLKKKKTIVPPDFETYGNKCNRCGKPGHWARSCPEKQGQNTSSALDRLKEKVLKRVRGQSRKKARYK